jgi:hypothetical protein
MGPVPNVHGDQNRPKACASQGSGEPDDDGSQEDWKCYRAVLPASATPFGTYGRAALEAVDGITCLSKFALTEISPVNGRV